MKKNNANVKHRYRLNAYSNFKEHKGYYVLTYGKYKIFYASMSFYDMYNFIKENKIPFDDIHLNNLTLKDLFDYMSFDDNERI